MLDGEDVLEGQETESRLVQSMAYLSTWRIKMVAAIAGDPSPARIRGASGEYERTLGGMDTLNGSIVPPGHVFALGLSADSIDSRHWGPVRLQRFTRLVLFKLSMGTFIGHA